MHAAVREIKNLDKTGKMSGMTERATPTDDLGRVRQAGRMRTILARFIGQDGSLGYRNGENYLLTVRGNEIVKPIRCPYGSVEAFLRNWEVLEA